MSPNQKKNQLIYNLVLVSFLCFFHFQLHRWSPLYYSCLPVNSTQFSNMPVLPRPHHSLEKSELLHLCVCKYTLCVCVNTPPGVCIAMKLLTQDFFLRVPT